MYDWHISATRYLDLLGKAEYDQFLKRGGKGRFAPSDYMNDLIGFANRDDEEAFKALVMLRGADSALGLDYIPAERKHHA